MGQSTQINYPIKRLATISKEPEANQEKSEDKQ